MCKVFGKRPGDKTRWRWVDNIYCNARDQGLEKTDETDETGYR